MNTDKTYDNARERLQIQLKAVEQTLKSETYQLYFDRKFNLHTLA